MLDRLNLDHLSRDRVVWRQAVAQVVGALVSLGVIGAGTGSGVLDTTDNVLEVWVAASPVVGLLSGLIGAALAKRKTTPVDDPQNDAGEVLVPAPDLERVGPDGPMPYAG